MHYSVFVYRCLLCLLLLRAAVADVRAAGSFPAPTVEPGRLHSDSIKKFRSTAALSGSYNWSGIGTEPDQRSIIIAADIRVEYRHHFLKGFITSDFRMQAAYGYFPDSVWWKKKDESCLRIGYAEKRNHWISIQSDIELITALFPDPSGLKLSERRPYTHSGFMKPFTGILSYGWKFTCWKGGLNIRLSPAGIRIAHERSGSFPAAYAWTSSFGLNALCRLHRTFWSKLDISGEGRIYMPTLSARDWDLRLTGTMDYQLTRWVSITWDGTLRHFPDKELVSGYVFTLGFKTRF